MITIDCANDNELAEELGSYLQNHDYTAKIDKDSVVTVDTNLDQILESFLAETKRSGYNIRKIDSTTILLAKEVPIEDFGFLRCEMCGYVVSSEEELLTHRRAHGIQLL